MNQKDPSQRRRWGAFIVLSAAAGAAFATAVIPVAPAFAEPTDAAVGAAANIAVNELPILDGLLFIDGASPGAIADENASLISCQAGMRQA